MLASGLGKSWGKQTETIALRAQQYATTRQLASTTLLKDQAISTPSPLVASSHRFPSLSEQGIDRQILSCRFHSTAPQQQQQVTKATAPQQRVATKAEKKTNERPLTAQLRHLSRNLRPELLPRVGELLDQIYHNEPTSRLKMGTFVGLVQQCIDMKSFPAANAAQRYLFEMLRFHDANRLDESPKPQFFGLVLQAWVSSGARQAGYMAEQLLDRLLALEQQKRLPVRVEAAKYNKVIYAYAMNGDLKGAQTVFLRCRHAFENGNPKARPDKFSWNALLNAHAKSGEPQAWSMAEEVFADMKRSYQNGILLEPPNTVSYNALLDVCAKCHQPERADYWLEQMCRQYETGNTAVLPTTWSFNSTMNAWSHSNAEDGAQRAEAILDTMMELAEKTHLPVRPDTISYNIVCMAYAKRGLPREAERIFQRQQDDFQAGNESAVLEVRTYNTLIHAWVVAQEKDVSGEKAEQILDHVVDLHQRGLLPDRPNFHTYIKVVNAWGEAGQPTRASLVFDRMFDDYKNHNNASARPDPTVFKSMLLLYGHSGAANAGELADKLLLQMSQLQYRPDVKMHLIPMIMCWRVSAKHGHPQAEERIKAIQAVIDSMQQANKKANGP